VYINILATSGIILFQAKKHLNNSHLICTGMAEFMIMPPIIIGAAIGIYEIILVHRDAPPIHRFGHSIHAFVYAIVACFATMNTAWMFETFTFLQGIPLMSPIVFQIVVGIITMVKIHVVSRAVKGVGGMGMGYGMGETWFHSFLVGALVVAAPYVYPLVQPVLPAWVQ
jgi:hypothetical protein